MMSDQQSLMIRETMGVSTDTHERAFNNQVIRALRARKAIPGNPAVPPRHLIVAVDPSGGGTSHFAVVSIFAQRGTIAVRCLLSCQNPRHEGGTLKDLERDRVVEEPLDRFAQRWEERRHLAFLH